jgi:hypothetical protein
LIVSRRIAPLLIAIVVALVAVPASAASDLDPDDVAGPLDLRWFGATFTSDGEHVRFTVSFHDDFRRAAIHKRRDGRGLWVHIADNLDGYFTRRRDGRTVFYYGDLGSTCGAVPRTCYKAPVRFPATDLVRVTFEVRISSDHELRAETLWENDADEPIRDRTAVLDLGSPP